MGDRCPIDGVAIVGTDRRPPSVRSFGAHSEAVDSAGGENHSAYVGTGRVLPFGEGRYN